MTTSIFFLMQTMGSISTNVTVHMDSCVSDIYCDIDLNVEAIFDAVANGPCEWTFKQGPPRKKDHDTTPF